MNSDSLPQHLKSLGLELGFAQIGIAPAVTPTGFHRLLQWIEQRPFRRHAMGRTSQRCLPASGRSHAGDAQRHHGGDELQ